MNTIQRGILTLLASAIREESLPLPGEFDISQVPEAIAGHHMAPLVYDGAIRCGISKDHPVMQGLFRSYCKGLLQGEGQLQALEKLYAAFDREGISYLPLKGCNMKHLYSRQELRTMGDADILIRVEEYGRIVPILEELGFTFKTESDHELSWTSPQLYLELHKCLIPSYNKDLYGYFGDGWSRTVKGEGSRFHMTPEDDFIFQFTHFAKHYRDGGIGCRYVVDLWVYRRAYPELKEDYLRSELEKLQLLEFYENIMALIGVWFAGAPETPKTEYLTEYIFASGSWGKMESKTLSRAVRDSRHSLLGFSGRLLYLWQTAFPPLGLLKEKYTVLQKAPWLLPVVWLIRPFYKVIFERSSLKKQQANLQELSRENMNRRREMLQYVGLDYRF